MLLEIYTVYQDSLYAIAETQTVLSTNYTKQ